MNLICIDPGVSGGVCLRTEVDLQCFRMPASLAGKVELLIGLKLQALGRIEAVMEDVGFHVVGSNAQGSAKLARGVGQLEGILMALNIPVKYVRPVTWMTAFPDRPKSLVQFEKIKLKAQYPSYSAAQFQKVIAEVNASRKRRRKQYIKEAVQRAFPEAKLYTRWDKKGNYYVRITEWAADALGILLWAERQ